MSVCFSFCFSLCSKCKLISLLFAIFLLLLSNKKLQTTKLEQNKKTNSKQKNQLHSKLYELRVFSWYSYKQTLDLLFSLRSLNQMNNECDCAHTFSFIIEWIRRTEEKVNHWNYSSIETNKINNGVGNREIYI